MFKKKIAGLMFLMFLLFTSVAVNAATFTDNQIVDKHKDWTITFNQEILESSIQEGIEVVDITNNSACKINNITTSLGQDTKTIIVNAPTEGYCEGDTYALVIKTKVKSIKNIPLKTETKLNFSIESDKDLFEGYSLIEVDGGDQSGHRESNVVVDIGFGDREYYAFTNEYGQLVKVTAKEIILQDDSTEPVLSNGRYYSDEAKVPGVESATLDEGHVIADSLGGVSNAYNITPQNSTLNRYGNQAYMERAIRNADGCTDFIGIITYPNITTQIPNHYSFTYTLKGNIINDEFDNVNSDEETPIEETPIDNDTNKQIEIIKLDKKAEYIVLKNISSDSINLTGWTILSVRGEQTFTFSEFSLEPNSTVKVGDSVKNPDVDFHWLDGRGTWNNNDSDPAELYDPSGNLVFRFND